MARGIEIKDPDGNFKRDPRTETMPKKFVSLRRTLAIGISQKSSPPGVPHARFRGRYDSIADTDWSRQAFILLNQLFQMTLTDVSGVGAPPIAIAK